MSTSATPKPRPDDEEPTELDQVIAKIDAALPVIHAKAKNPDNKTPTGAFKLRDQVKTQEMFVAMSEEDPLHDSREEEPAPPAASPEADTPPPIPRVVTKPIPKPEDPSKSKLRFRR